MNWFVQFKHDFGIESNYQISKKTGITASSLTRLNTSKDWESVKIGTMIKLATITGKTLDDFVNYLEESKNND